MNLQHKLDKAQITNLCIYAFWLFISLSLLCNRYEGVIIKRRKKKIINERITAIPQQFAYHSGTYDLVYRKGSDITES